MKQLFSRPYWHNFDYLRHYAMGGSGGGGNGVSSGMLLKTLAGGSGGGGNGVSNWAVFMPIWPAFAIEQTANAIKKTEIFLNILNSPFLKKL